MATVTITCSDGPGPFAEGAEIKLEAALDTGSAKKWAWKRDTTVLADTASSTDLTVATDTEGMYVATATLDNDTTVESVPFEVKKKTGDGGGATESPPWFATSFAVWVAIVGALAVVLVLFVLGLFGPQLRLSDTEWNTLDARAKVATRIAVPIVVLGSIAVVVGMWMALVEWRGRFEKPASPPPAAGVRRGAGEDAAKVIDSVGKLGGAALVMVVGALLMFAAAWITQSTAKPPTTPTSTTTTAAR